MGKLKLIQGYWSGKVGEFTGAKWKSRKTVRAYAVPADPKTAAQQEVRTTFGEMNSFVALFADQIKYKSALDTKAQSVRNAIVKLNKDQIEMNSFDPTALEISKGGLQKPMGFTVQLNASGNTLQATWTKPTATNFSEKAVAIIVAVDSENQVVDVVEAKFDDESANGTVAFDAAAKPQCYMYYLDYRGSNKVASLSVASAVA